MDEKTKTMMLTIGAGIAKKGLMIAGTSLAGHGVIAGNQVETFVSIGMVLVGLGWSLWNDYGKAIVLSQLEVLKAKSLAQAAKMRQANLPPVTADQIAAESPKLTPADVTKTVATLSVPLQNTVAKVMIVGALFGLLAFPGDASAQAVRKPQITGDIVADTKANLGSGGGTGLKLTGSPLKDLLGALEDSLLPDLQYALKLAKASDSKVTAPCYEAWIAIIEKRKTAVTNADGTPMDLPNPRLVTDFEKMVELRNALQPESDFMLKCSPVANMVKQDMIKFIGSVLAGGVGLAALGL